MAGESDDPPTPSSEIRRLWDERARSPHREFYVASHRGWNDTDRAEHQARFDAEVVLHDLAPADLADADVLEIGCGSGRLAAQIAARVRSYRGFDIAPGMVDAARERLGGTPNAEVFVGSGEGPHEACRGRRYALVFSHAVLIHCPRDIIAANIREAWPLVARDGRMRLQLLADADDPTGIEPLSAAPTLPIDPPPELGDLSADEQRDLEAIDGELRGTYYMGHAFRYADVAPFVSGLTPDGRVTVRRFDPQHVHVEVVRDDD